MRLGAVRAPVGLQNLEASQTDETFGTTEKVLISMWFAFTAGVFGLLYKITKEADEECEEQMKPRSNVSVARVEGYQQIA